jgi:uncharacterized membrane protein
MTANTTTEMGTDRRNAGIVLAAATVAMGLIAGLYFGWAVSVMPGLSGVEDRTFVEAMQGIDDAIRNPLFFATFLGALALTAAAAFMQWELGARRATTWVMAALVLYGIGAVTTMAFNEPLNKDLVDAGDPSRIADLAAVREAFEDEWVAWHIVRTVTTIAALGSLAYAMLLYGWAARQPARVAPADLASPSDEGQRQPAGSVGPHGRDPAPRLHGVLDPSEAPPE